MKADDMKRILDEQGIRADRVHLDAGALGVASLLKGTAERFAKLALEAEPSGFQAEQRRRAP